MRSHQRSVWLKWLTALIAGLGLALGASACDRNEGAFEGPDEQATGVQQEEQAQDEAFGAFDEEVEPEGAEGGQLGQQDQQDQQAQQEPFGQPTQPNQLEQPDQQAQQEQAAQQGDDTSVEDLQPGQISDQDLAQFAELRLRLIEARQSGATGGGPPEGEELEEWETEMIQNSGMEVDRYLAIRMMLQDEPQLQQRYEQVIKQMHDQPAQQQQGQPQPGQQY